MLQMYKIISKLSFHITSYQVFIVYKYNNSHVYQFKFFDNFLMFVTGSNPAPMGGLGALRPPAHASFKVQRAGPDSDALPTSHTCFNTLLLPEYDHPQKVAKLLEYAVREGHEGFALE